MTVTPESTSAAGPSPVVVTESPRGFGWIFFASIVMVMAGIMQAIYGLIAILNDEWVVWGNRAALYLDLTQWGWVHLILGIVVAVSGFGLLSGNVLARIVALVIACLSLLANFLFIPAYPLWALTVIVIDVMVIWAISVHGGELRNV